MKKIFLTLGLILTVLMASAQDCSELFISEYVEGSGNNKGVEIYNPTGEMVNLGSYYIARYSNGALTYDAGGLTQLEGFLPPYNTHFLVNGQTVTTETSPACDPALQAIAQQLDHVYPAPTYMNGNDAIALFKDPVGSGDIADFLVIDLFGIIGGGMQKSDVGWASFTDEWTYKNIYDGEEITGTDSVFITNYIVPEGYYWLPWSANHSLIRKASVKGGVTANPDPAFVVSMEWDTVAGGIDIWDFIGMHDCECDPSSSVENSFEKVVLDIYPNPARNYLHVEAALPFQELILYDASGRELYREAYQSATVSSEIMTEQFPAGIYHLRIKFVDREQTEKVMIL